MASDRQQFRDALTQWDELHSAANFSIPSEIGRTAILLPYNHQKYADINTVESYDYLARQALGVADVILQQTGKAPEVALDASDIDFKEVLTNPTFTSVVVIGKGTLSSIEAPTPSGLITWRDVSSAADHLKRGQFYQLFCGGTRKNLNVPMGTFAMADHRSVLTPGHRYIRSRANLKRLIANLEPVTDRSRMNLQHIKEHFPYDNYYGRKDELIAGIDRAEQHLRNGTLITALKAKLKAVVQVGSSH